LSKCLYSQEGLFSCDSYTCEEFIQIVLQLFTRDTVLKVIQDWFALEFKDMTDEMSLRFFLFGESNIHKLLVQYCLIYNEESHAYISKTLENVLFEILKDDHLKVKLDPDEVKTPILY
jgi:hypothetical protein